MPVPQNPLNDEGLYMELGRLIEAMPNLFDIGSCSEFEIERWLGRAYALLKASGEEGEAEALKSASKNLFVSNTMMRDRGARSIVLIMHRAVSVAELKAPVKSQGSFIPAGNSFDAFAAFAKVLGTATNDILMVDPYMDEKALSDFAVTANEGVAIRLLADEHSKKASLKPAVERWSNQYGPKRPLEARLAGARSLHDRLLIIDGTTAWVLTQSMNAFAERAPASIVRVDTDTASLKVVAYSTIWSNAAML
jgi:phosphatidylserine/phosphatidylglycerophosphate/cardiolipin synthase-like enzyme